MKRLCKVFFCLLMLQTQYAVSQDRAWDQGESREFKEAIVPAIIAGTEILILNTAFTLVNWISGWPWALPTNESIRNNLTTAWQWEYDNFLVNQMGHPLHGGLKFTAGRLNGFGFYSSAFFTAFGSAAWEIMGEDNQAAINDFITTIPSSMIIGEIIYRMSLEAHAAGFPLPVALMFNPVSGIHILISNWKPPDTGRNLHELRLYAGGAYAFTNYSVSGSQKDLFSFEGPYADIGISAIYGNPFEQDTRIPFRHFEFSLSTGMNPLYYNDVRFHSDGYLISFSPVYSDTQSMSTGLSAHMDFKYQGDIHLHDSTINQYSNALNWTIKYQQLFSETTYMQLKYHAGITFWGASKYYSPEGEIDVLNTFGYGVNSKLFFNLGHTKLGRLETYLFYYVLWNYPETSGLSQGIVHSLFADITYSYIFSERFSIGISHSISREWGYFSGLPDTRKRNNTIRTFAMWSFY